MADLSPAAQAVLTASAKARCFREWDHVNDPPCHPNDAHWNGCYQCVDRGGVAAALRAAADHLPSSAMYPSCDWGYGWRTGISDAKQKLLAIAAELEGSNG